jgi:hypothetical protein
MVFLSRIAIVPLDHPMMNIGNDVWLPMGAVLLSYIYFGWGVLPAVYIGYIAGELFNEGGFNNIENYEYISRLINSIVPLLVYLVMNKFNFKWFNDVFKTQMNYLNVGYLIIISALLTTLTKHLLLFGPEAFYAGKVYFQSFIVGDIIGGAVFILIIFNIIKIFNNRH